MMALILSISLSSCDIDILGLSDIFTNFGYPTKVYLPAEGGEKNDM